MELKFLDVNFCLVTDWNKDKKTARIIESWDDCIIAPINGDIVILDDENKGKPRGYYEVVSRMFENCQEVTCVVRFIQDYYEH